MLRLNKTQRSHAPVYLPFAELQAAHSSDIPAGIEKILRANFLGNGLAVKGRH